MILELLADIHSVCFFYLGANEIIVDKMQNIIL